ncbi:MAG: carbon-nitrogen hydrolase family protein [Nocardioidaceae bacterium]
MATLNVCLLELASTLDPEENRRALDVIGRVARPGDLVVLPEAFMCDFGAPGTDVSAWAETLDGPFVTRLVGLAGAHDVTVVAGMFEVSADPTRPYNTVVVVDEGGPLASYRKIHLYDSFGYRESDRLLAGEPRPAVVEVAGLRLGLMTCYDLRFPELGRRLVDAGAQALVVPSAWVAGPLKLDHWRTLVEARAIENTVYAVAAAQPGPRYTGHSMVVSPMGEVLVEIDGEATARAVLSSDEVQRARRTNPSLANRRLGS